LAQAEAEQRPGCGSCGRPWRGRSHHRPASAHHRSRRPREISAGLHAAL